MMPQPWGTQAQQLKPAAPQCQSASWPARAPLAGSCRGWHPSARAHCALLVQQQGYRQCPQARCPASAQRTHCLSGVRTVATVAQLRPQALSYHRRRSATCARASSSAESQPSDEQPAADGWDRLAALAQRFTGLFPLWVVLCAVAALVEPGLYTWAGQGWIVWGLAVTMLGMGLTMKVDEFIVVFQRMPALLLLGLALQYTVMPGLGYVFSRFAGLDASLATGIALLSACPGGTASNIVAFIAGGEMGLSILMTTASTLAAVVATPFITQALAGAFVPVNGQALFMSTLQVVLAPVLLGVLVNQRFPVTVAKCARFTPALATLVVALIVGATLANSAQAARASGVQLLGAVFSLHASGFLIGYWVSRVLGLSEKICRTNSIEVGMQNSTLGAVLASLHFTDPLVAAPCAVSACTHSVLGSLLAGYWRTRPAT